MTKILIVEDEKPIANLIDWNLSASGYSCTRAYDGNTAADLIAEHNYDLVLLDIMLPGIDGYELLRQIKPTGTPVIFITAKGSVQDRVQGLRAGADDYLVKPFEIVELIARVESVLRRAGKASTVYTLGDVTVDTESMLVTKAGAPVTLTRKEYDLLLLFLPFTILLARHFFWINLLIFHYFLLIFGPMSAPANNKPLRSSWSLESHHWQSYRQYSVCPHRS